ncbi:MAG TPA: hypothetical protein VHR27_17935 [Blastocatellia bacterium]|nr:hypothetical protein [Blastocatellia bacterium]
MSVRCRAIRLIALAAARYRTGALLPVHPIENRPDLEEPNAKETMR